MVIIKINNTALPTPDPKPTHKTIAEHSQGYTDAAGYLHKVTIRPKRGRIDFTWTDLTTAQKDLIENMTKGQSGEWIKFEYYNPETGQWTTWNEAYAGDFEASDHYVKTSTGYSAVWSCKVGIIER